MLIDTHAHLTDSRFNQDRDEVLKRALQAGVSRIVEIACEPGAWQAALGLARAYPFVSCAVGIHPQEAKLCTEEVFGKLADTAALPEVAAVGETGLDYYYENSPRNVQRDVFERHIELSRKTGKPLVIHCRDAYPDLIEILKGRQCRGVIHCFSGTPQQAEILSGMGFYLGIDGPVTYPKVADLRETVRKISLERLLIETDSPYLPPQAYRGKRNEPSYAPLIAEEIAKIRGADAVLVAKITTLNASSLFGTGC